MIRSSLTCFLLAPVAAGLFPASALAADAKCHTNRFFMVQETKFENETGTQFVIRGITGQKTPKDCHFKPTKKDFVIGRADDALYFDALDGKWLILTRSTGPQGALVVYDLTSHKSVLDIPCDRHEVKNGQLSFWQRVGEGDAKTCPEFAEHQANGFGSVLTQLKTFDLKSGKLSETDNRRCEPTQ